MDFNKKEMPIQGFTGFGGGATGSAFRSSGGEKTYVEDVFSMDVWEGDASTRSIVNNLDLSTDGGLVWMKERTGGASHVLFDTERGATKALECQGAAAQETQSTSLTAFNTNGFTVGSGSKVNDSGKDYANWSLLKAPGFFDVVTYSGNGSARTISHNLGCIPGMMIIKRTDDSDNWFTYHRESPNATTSYLRLNETSAPQSDGSNVIWNGTAPTSTVFSVGTDGGVNDSSGTYVAYLFAGGESTAATARSVNFVDGSTQTLRVANNADFNFGSGDFTVEGWFNIDHQDKQHGCASLWGYANSRRSWLIQTDNSANGPLEFAVSGTGGNSGSGWNFMSGGTINPGQWYHFAAVRDGSNLRLFLNGKQVALTTGYSGTLYNNTNDDVYIGSVDNNTNAIGDWMDGNISNIRITKGQALYTTAFKVPTEPLTTTSQGATASNVKLLCCNNSSTTGSTVTSGTITALNSPTASTDSPFDDPAAFIFGEDGDESLVKCSSYTGNGSATRPEIYLGWEPQWILIKNATNVNNWYIWDSLRGWVTEGNSQYIFANENTVNGSTGEGPADGIDRLPDGFNTRFSGGGMNASGDKYVYWAVRRPDGYVGKSKTATEVYAQDTGNGSTDGPSFDSGFPVDFLLRRVPSGGGGLDATFIAYERILGLDYLQTANTSAESTSSRAKYDLMTGANHTDDSSYSAWMFKRHAGFDVVAYKGDHVDNRTIPHSLGISPEMIWTKNRGSTENWVVWHSGMPNSGDGENATAHMLLNLTNATAHAGLIYGGTGATMPTSTHYSVGTHETINDDNYNYVSMLFTSVSGISKCGSYTGDDSDDGTYEINVGFTPRFLIIKRTDNGADWKMFNTLTGFPSSGAAAFMELNTTDDSYSGATATVTQSTNGFKLWSPGSPYNAGSAKYIYYAHA